MEIITLNLLSPLFYIRDETADPFGWREEKGEMLFCFQVDPVQRQSIEPDEDSLLSALIFGGQAAGSESPAEAKLRLPAGKYLFAQERDVLSPGEIGALAAEVQKEGLWRRLSPGGEVYLRYLFEDGWGVTQIFRPYTKR